MGGDWMPRWEPRGALALGPANGLETTLGYTVASYEMGAKSECASIGAAVAVNNTVTPRKIAMKTPMTALLVAAVLVSGIVTFASPTAAKRKHVYAYSSLTYGYRIGSPRWWRAMDRAGRGGRPGGI